jgi:hypothetical protein
MKIRKGFVSNSSTTSFVCDICGASEAGMDASPQDFGFIQCQNEHIICEDEALEGYIIYDNTGNNGDPDEYSSEIRNAVDMIGSCISEEFCPICQFEVASNKDIDRYLSKKFPQYTHEDVFIKVKEINKRRKKLYPSEYIQYVYEKTEIFKIQRISIRLTFIFSCSIL